MLRALLIVESLNLCRGGVASIEGGGRPSSILFCWAALGGVPQLASAAARTTGLRGARALGLLRHSHLSGILHCTERACRKPKSSTPPHTPHPAAAAAAPAAAPSAAPPACAAAGVEGPRGRGRGGRWRWRRQRGYSYVPLHSDQCGGGTAGGVAGPLHTRPLRGQRACFAGN